MPGSNFNYDTSIADSVLKAIIRSHCTNHCLNGDPCVAHHALVGIIDKQNVHLSEHYNQMQQMNVFDKSIILEKIII